MNFYKRPQTQEQDARDACALWGKDPDEDVWGQTIKDGRFKQPRWRWYVGTSARLAREGE